MSTNRRKFLHRVSDFYTRFLLEIPTTHPIESIVPSYLSAQDGFKDFFTSLFVVTRLRLRRFTSWRMLRMGLVGVAGVTVQTIIFELLAFHLDIVRPSLAAVIGGEVAILSNFLLNNYFTFRGHGHPNFSKFARFHLVSLGSVVIQAVLIFVIEHFTTVPMIIRLAYALGVVIGFFTNYAGFYFLVWKHNKRGV